MNTKIEVEYFLGDLIKVVASQLEDLLDEDQLQIAEIIAIVKARLNATPIQKSIVSKRPKAPKNYLKNYHSGNEYCRTVYKRELNTKSRLDVITACFHQSSKYDGLSKEEFFSLCESYVRAHFSDGEDVVG